VTGILARSADQEMLLLVDPVASVVLAHLEGRRQLDRVRRAGLLAEPAIDAARGVDADPFRIPPPRLVLGFLQRDAIDGARDRAEIARDAALVAVRVPRQDDPAAKPRGEIGLLFGILDRLPAAKAVQEDRGHRSDLAEQHGELRVKPALAAMTLARAPALRALEPPSGLGPALRHDPISAGELVATTIAPVTTTL